MAGVATAVQTTTPTGIDPGDKSENVLVGFEGYTDENN